MAAVVELDIRIFRSAAPCARSYVTLACACPAAVFSNHVIQNFALRDLDDHLGMAARSLTPSGRIVPAGISWDVMYWPFCCGLFAKGKPQAFPRSVAYYLLAILGLKKSLGTCYLFQMMRKIAAKHGLLAYFFESLIYPYRFHVESSKYSDGR